METEKKYKTIFQIRGYTKSRQRVSIGWNREIRFAIHYFIDDFPEFRGKVQLVKKVVEQTGNPEIDNFRESEVREEVLATFTSRKQVDAYVNKHYQII